jgi:metal-responsive CopG/Arc/MetJ family transcriptional regulator
MKAAVSIPDPVFEAADKLARRMGVTRSRLYSIALQRFVQNHEESIDRMQRTRLAREAAKLDRTQEQALADEAYAAETEWPEYLTESSKA